MRLTILASSSAGNCALLQTERATVLIDAGLSGKRICERLEATGVRPEEIDAIFLTHEHGDHVSGLRGLSRYHRPRVHANRATARAVHATLPRTLDWQLFESGTRFEALGLRVSSFRLPHDAHEPVGFLFETGHEGDLFDPPRTLAWVTDLGYVPGLVHERVKEADLLLLEANHCTKLLHDHPERPWVLKQRISSRHGHLSNDAALAFLQEHERPRWKRVLLGHLSRECNDVRTVRELFHAGPPNGRPYSIDVLDPSREEPVAFAC